MGKHPHGFVVARLDADQKPAQCRLSRCFARGADLKMLHLSGQGWDVQLDDSLLVSGSATAIASDCAPKAPLTVRVLRSTVVTGKDFLQLQTPADLPLAPTIHVKLLDALLAHSDLANPGNLLTATGQLETYAMRWRATNVVYAGWNKLLRSSNLAIVGTDLAAWQGRWSNSQGERALADIWPKLLPTELEEVARPARFPPRALRPIFPRFHIKPSSGRRSKRRSGIPTAANG